MSTATSTPPQGMIRTTAPPESSEGLKDTIESVVVAFILAFVFRAFLVEAFVIPTGSMAPTLYGRHGTITCEDCGWEFAYGLADQSSGSARRSGVRLVKRSSRALCPNCGHENTNLRINDLEGPRGNAEPGDRILVLKWPFDIGGSRIGPQRWDVTVFKDPSRPTGRPAPPVPQNFIKRLIGLPNEVLEIIDGDIYTVPSDELSPETMETLDRLRRLKYLLRDGNPHTPDPGEEREAGAGLGDALAELNGRLRIARKTRQAQEELWFIVYHHDYPPTRPDPGQPRWAPCPGFESVWDTSQRKIRCAAGGGPGGYIQFTGKPIRNLCAYNVTQLHAPRQPVSDLRLELVLVPESGSGHLGLVLTKHDDVFEARIGMDGRARLYRTAQGDAPDDQAPLCEQRLAPLVAGRPLEIAFEVVDYRVSLAVDGEEVLATTDDDYAPNIAWLRRGAHLQGPPPGPRITASDLACELWHVALRRDVYYTRTGADPRTPAQARTGWGTTGRPIWLREGEYFMLGDNSPASKDSRLWDMPGDHLLPRKEAYQLGTVPQDQLIGRAFFVYWPSGHRTELIPFLRNRGIIPNFGRMRWIR